MKATKLLVQQHEKVKKALTQLAEGKGDLATTLKEVADDLAAHMAIEQQLFYPSVLSIKKDLVNESYEEHSVAELALKRLLRTPPTEALFKARATVLKELIEHHVKEEEEDLFPAVEKAMAADALEQLGTKMEMLFKQSRAQGFEALVPSGYAKTSADEFERAVGAEGR
jgi:iron-sulfur cluster repair protein YtfE (RIC family)